MTRKMFLMGLLPTAGLVGLTKVDFEKIRIRQVYGRVPRIPDGFRKVRFGPLQKGDLYIAMLFNSNHDKYFTADRDYPNEPRIVLEHA